LGLGLGKVCDGESRLVGDRTIVSVVFRVECALAILELIVHPARGLLQLRQKLLVVPPLTVGVGGICIAVAVIEAGIAFCSSCIADVRGIINAPGIVITTPAPITVPILVQLLQLCVHLV